jgi:transposase
MEEITTIGVDIAKNVFQLHGINAEGQVVLRKALRRGQMQPFFEALSPCLIGMEACATAHHWARTLIASGHDVRLIPPNYIKPYLRRQKNDAADAAAICEAVTRPSMRFVPVKNEDQQATLMLHSARELLISQQTALINALRGHFAELGIVAPQGARNVRQLIAILEDERYSPQAVRTALTPLATVLIEIEGQITRRSLPPIATTMSVSGLRPFPELGPSLQLAFRPASQTQSCSKADVSSQPGWALSPGSIRPVANQGWAPFPKWATGTCANSSWLGRTQPSTG